MRRSDQRILTTHTGSLPRPAALLESTDGQGHETMLRESVADIVRQQLDVGLEIRRDELIPLNWLGRDRERFAEFFAQEMPSALAGAPTEVCVSPITYQG